MELTLRQMMKRALVLSSLVVLLVGSLMYCISPDELGMIYAAARDRLSTEVIELLASTSDRRTNFSERSGQPVPGNNADHPSRAVRGE